MRINSVSGLVHSRARLGYVDAIRQTRPFSQSSSKSLADPGFIILNPIQAGLVKVKPRKLQKRRRLDPLTSSPPTTYLDNLSLNENDPEPVVSAIHSQRPETTAITNQRYSQIVKELVKGFKKEHLEDYLKAQRVVPAVFRKMTKKKMAEYIMSDVWKTVSKESQEDNNEHGVGLVENVIDLSEEEFVLVLGNNGRLLREWSKSGAKISILPARFQIIVSSSPKTFEWINASLGLFLESLVQREIDLTNVRDSMRSYLDTAQVASSGNDVLTVMQRLTNTFFRPNADGLLVYGAGRSSLKNISLVRRLLLQISQRCIDSHWKSSQWWFDTNPENITKYRFRPFDDTDSLEWIDRVQSWWRWELVKTKKDIQGQDSSNSLPPLQLKSLKVPEFGETAQTEDSITTPSLDAPLSSSSESTLGQVELVISELVERTRSRVPSSITGDSISTTVTITPGFVLHDQSSLAGVPNAGTQKTFTSNIPYVSNLASSLPMFAKDMRHEEEINAETNIVDAVVEDIKHEDTKHEDSNTTDSWASILNLDGETDDKGRTVFVSRHKELDFATNLKLIQMKFVVDPNEDNADEYPPIEAWAELPPLNASDNTRLQDLPRIVAVPLEASAHVSIPTSKADLKITCAQTYPVPITDAVEKYFFNDCRFGRIGALEVKPELEIEWGSDRKVTYKYHSTHYVTLAELEFRGQMVQFSQIEGGKLGGRKIEANLVNHSEGTPGAGDYKAMAEKALEFTSLL